VKTELQQIFDKVLSIYSAGDHYQRLLEAKKIYSERTGIVYEDDDEYENRMNCFNDWYLFHHLSKDLRSTIIWDFLEKHKEYDSSVRKSFQMINYSLFEVLKAGCSQLILHDLLHRKKLKIKLGQRNVGCVSKDILVGRVIEHHGEMFLLGGVCVLPPETKKILRAYTRKIHVFRDFNVEYRFLQRLEFLKVRWMRYKHVDISKLFVV